ncbi:hypothetical protein QW131_23070 [Roseibium salinum]|nr:hypothetical protein [Roseibium salinum]
MRLADRFQMRQSVLVALHRVFEDCRPAVDAFLDHIEARPEILLHKACPADIVAVPGPVERIEPPM